MIFEGSPNSLTEFLFFRKIKTGGVLIHRRIRTEGALNLVGFNSSLHRHDWQPIVGVGKKLHFSFLLSSYLQLFFSYL